MDVLVPSGMQLLGGSLEMPPESNVVVLFAHGSGSSRLSGRNRFVAERLNAAGLGTLLFDLLTAEEEQADRAAGAQRFDIALLSGRLQDATRWIVDHLDRPELLVGYFGASTGAAAALDASTRMPEFVRAIVSRGGRPDLAPTALPLVKVPTLLIVGGNDRDVLNLNLDAYGRLTCPKDLKIVPGATHLFEEPGALGQVADAAIAWFKAHLH
jgi:pimeloyl-ACP methyl ester carboxylesterase